MKLKKLLLSALVFFWIGASAHDFAVTQNGQHICFEITNKNKKTVSVTYCGSIADKKTNNVSGVVQIPSKVEHNNMVYTVNAIGPKAFANQDKLQGIVIPAGIEAIGDFAFEGCSSLKSIIFPSNPVRFGQGVFFKCQNISDVTIGGDWKSIDFTMFRWSDKLTSINIPAKIDKIQGVKRLVALAEISVDPNNTKFSARNGMLLSKDGSILFACPRAYKGKIKVPEGTRTVFEGALTDCTDITVVDLPSTIQSMSFRETSRMKKLETIILRSEIPFATGYYNGIGKFFFQLPNPDVNIIVSSSSKKRYIADLPSFGGEFSESPGATPYLVPLSELPTKKNFKGVKNFDKY